MKIHVPTIGRTFAGLVSTLIVAACADADLGTGTLRVSVSGEEAAWSGYPVGSGDSMIAFADGWTLQFDKVVASFSGFELKTSDGDDAGLTAGPVVADLHLGKPELWNFEDIPAQRWDRVGYRYTPPTAKARKANAVDDATLKRMIDEGYSLYIEAALDKGERHIELQYGFAFDVTQTRCVNGMDGTDGIVVAQAAINEAQITVHLDHLFFDSFATDGAKLRFDPMAAVAPEKDPLSLEDLAAQDNLSDLKDASGQSLNLTYDPGSELVPTPENLEQYVEAAATTTGHWNGEGHCHYARN